MMYYSSIHFAPSSKALDIIQSDMLSTETKKKYISTLWEANEWVSWYWKFATHELLSKLLRNRPNMATKHELNDSDVLKEKAS